MLDLSNLMVPSRAIKLQPRSGNMTHGKWVADHMGHDSSSPHHMGSAALPFAQAMGSSSNTKHPGRHGSYRHGSIAGMVMARMNPNGSGKGISRMIMGASEDNTLHLDAMPTVKEQPNEEVKKAPAAEPAQHHTPLRHPPNAHASAHGLLDEDHIRMLLGKVDADLMAKIRAAAVALEALFKDADSNSDGLLNYFEVKALFRRIGAGLADDVDKHVPEEERSSEPHIDFNKFVECFLPLALSVPTELLMTRIPATGDRIKDRASVAAIRKGTSMFSASHEAGVLPNFAKLQHADPHDSARGHFPPSARRSSVAARKIQEELDHHANHGHGHGHDDHGLGHGFGHGHDDHGHGQLHGGGFRGHIHHGSASQQKRNTHKNINIGQNEHGLGVLGPDLRRASVAITGQGLVVGLDLDGEHGHHDHVLHHHRMGGGAHNNRSSHQAPEGTHPASLAQQPSRRKSMAIKMRIGEGLFQEKPSRSSIGP